MELILHIGTEKTGTTTVQRWFDLNARALAEQGIFYSTVLGRPGHGRIALYGMDIGVQDGLMQEAGVTQPKDQQQLRLSIAEQFGAEVVRARAAGCRRFVISSEHCHSRLTTPAAVERVRALLAPHFSAMTVVCFLRPQLELALSLASTIAREGRPVSRADVTAGFEPDRAYFNYRRLLLRWTERFGADNVVAVSLRRNPDTIAYFRTLLDVDDAAFIRPPALNEALDYHAIRLANAILQPWLTAGWANPKARLAVADPKAAERLTIDRTTGRELQRRFEVSNRALVACTPNLELDDLTPDWEQYPQTGNIDRLEATGELAESLGAMMEWFNGELWWSRAQRQFADARRAEAGGRLAGGIGLCEQSLATLALLKRVPRWAQRADQLARQCEARMMQMKSALVSGTTAPATSGR